MPPGAAWSAVPTARLFRLSAFICPAGVAPSAFFEGIVL